MRRTPEWSGSRPRLRAAAITIATLGALAVGTPGAATAAAGPAASQQPTPAAPTPSTPTPSTPTPSTASLVAASLPATRPVTADVAAKPLAAPAPTPDSGGAKQVTSPDPLKLVAVTWTGAPPDVVELRSRLASGTYGAWTPVEEVETERDGRAAASRGTDPVWVGDTREVQVRALRAGAPVTDQVTLASIDPKISANDAPIGSGTATGSPAAPKVVTRAQWGADERLMTWRPEYTPTVRAVTIHHTAGSNSYSPADSAAIVRGIYSYHAKTQGWGDIGYNVLVDRFGTVFEGRAGGLDRSVIAAHAGGFNRETFGIGMMGTFTSVAPPAATLESTAKLAAYKLGGLYRDPRGTVTLTSAGGGTSKYAAGRRVTLPTIFAHRDVGATECPGDTGVRSMPALRDRVAALVGNQATNPIRTKWLTLAGLLGDPSVVEGPTARSARVTRFQGANTVYWSATTRAWSVIGAINGRYDAIGAAAGPVGLPTTDELVAPDGRGRFNRFQLGNVYWTPQTGAWPVRGAILATWAAQGYERGALGYPRSDEYAVTGGLRQDFERGSLTWNRASGAVART